MISLPNSVILSDLDFNFDFEQTLGCSRPLAENPDIQSQGLYLCTVIALHKSSSKQ